MQNTHWSFLLLSHVKINRWRILALGLDRLAMSLTGSEISGEVIAFPKCYASAQCLKPQVMLIMYKELGIAVIDVMNKNRMDAVVSNMKEVALIIY